MRIVIVDDDRFMTRILSDNIKAILGDEVEITVYNDPLVAKEKVGSRPVPDIVFMDIEMPGMSGIELTKYARKVFPRGHIVFVTAYTEHALTAWQLHMDGYLLKPVQQEDLKLLFDHIGLLDDTARNIGSKLRIRCFGKFEVFRGEIPIKFSRSKAKELLAYLIAARGSAVTSGELCGILWDDATDIERKKTYLRQYASSLRAGLKAVDAEDVFIHNRDSYSVNIALINCDYYSYLRGNTMTVRYTGEFMSQYSWAEEIGAQLQ